MQNSLVHLIRSRIAWLALACLAPLLCQSGCSSLLATSELGTGPMGNGNAAAAEDNAPHRLGRLVSFVGGRRKKQPSHDRLWRPDLAVLPLAEIGHDRVLLKNIRDCQYRTENDYDVRHFDRQIMIGDVRTVDFIVVPFVNAPLIAHTMLSFGLANGEQIVFSVEARLEQGEGYALVAGKNNDYELMWVVGTERDLIRLRTEVRKVDVYLYPTRATPEQVQRVFLASVARVNQIARQPEFYDVVSNNCTTNIVDMVNELRPGSVPADIRVLLPGHSDRLAYDLGLLAAEGPFEQIKAASKINLAAQLYANDPNFSRALRQRH